MNIAQKKAPQAARCISYVDDEYSGTRRGLNKRQLRDLNNRPWKLMKIIAKKKLKNILIGKSIELKMHQNALTGRFELASRYLRDKVRCKRATSFNFYSHKEAVIVDSSAIFFLKLEAVQP
jgi:hypothetical protein